MVPPDKDEQEFARERYGLVLELAEHLGGLSIAEIDWVLADVRKVVCYSTDFDPAAPAYRRSVARYNEMFQAERAPPKKQ